MDTERQWGDEMLLATKFLSPEGLFVLPSV